MVRALLFVFVFLLSLNPAHSQFKHKKGKRVPKSGVYKAITAPVAENTVAGHNPELDGYYPSEYNADDKRTISPRKYKKSQKKALRKERRLARREEKARRKRERAAAKTQLANERNPTRRIKRPRSR